jgi:hypothetical protein
MRIKITNTTDVPTALIRKLVKFCMPKNVGAESFTLRVTNSSRQEIPFTVRNAERAPADAKLVRKGNNRNGVREGYTLYKRKSPASIAGSYYHVNPPHVVVRVSRDGYPTNMKPYQYAQHRGVEVPIADRTEALVFILAHELRHLWQEHGKYRNAPFPEGYGRVSRGGFSEVDTEAYAIQTLRCWREQNGSQQ